jgi:hypothetical protein
MTGNALILTAAAAAAASVGLLRYAWSLARRSKALNALGWGLLLLALVLGAMSDGAWGMAVVSAVATAVAMAVLTHAAITAPPARVAASNRRANMLPEGKEPKRIGGRLLTFLIAVPLAFIASVLIGMASRIAAAGAGLHEADSNALMLLIVPLVWTLLATVLLVWPARRMQFAVLLLPGLACAGLLAVSIVR